MREGGLSQLICSLNGEPNSTSCFCFALHGPIPFLDLDRYSGVIANTGKSDLLIAGCGSTRSIEQKMRNTRTIRVGEHVTVSHGSRGTFEGVVTENNPASSLIYVDSCAYERHEVRRVIRTVSLENCQTVGYAVLA